MNDGLVKSLIFSLIKMNLEMMKMEKQKSNQKINYKLISIA